MSGEVWVSMGGLKMCECQHLSLLETIHPHPSIQTCQEVPQDPDPEPEGAVNGARREVNGALRGVNGAHQGGEWNT